MALKKKGINKKRGDRIVILGGGFGGVRTVLDLARNLPESEIILVDKKSYHTYVPELYELTSAIFPGDDITDKDEFLKLCSTVSIPFQDIFGGFKNVTVKQDAVKGVDFNNNVVLLTSGKMEYDFLVLALGSRTNFFGIPHLGEKAFELKTADDALNIRAKLEELFKSRGKHEVISVVIGGGGFTGCELAGELAAGIKKLTKIYQHPPQNISISVVEASSTLLGAASPWFGKKAQKRLGKLGVRIRLDSFISDVKDGKVILKNGEEIKYDLLVWTAGVCANDIAEKLSGIELEKNKCVKADSKLHAFPYQNMFVIGDLAYCKNPNTGKPLAMTAQTAIAQGRYVAKCLISELRKKTCPDFRSKPHRSIVPLGGRYALADLGIIKISGFFPWLLKNIAMLRYFLGILPASKALRIWFQGFKIFLAND